MIQFLKRNSFLNYALEKRIFDYIYGGFFFFNLANILAAFPVYFDHVVLLQWISSGEVPLYSI